MYSLIVENKYGNQLELTHNPAYVVTEIDGLDPPDAVINATKNAVSDGSVFNSSYLDNRTITITLSINGPAEENRLNLYKYFKSKQFLRLYYENDSRSVYIDGYVKSLQVAYFDVKQVAQIVIVCPKPYFLDTTDDITEFSSVIKLFEFPFDISTPIPFSDVVPLEDRSVINDSDVEVGAIITIKANGTVLNPIITNTDTGEYFGVNISMAALDEIVINTRIGEKSVTSDDGLNNLIGFVQEGSTWFQLTPGDNVYSISADSGDAYLEVVFEITPQYEGV